MNTSAPTPADHIAAEGLGALADLAATCARDLAPEIDEFGRTVEHALAAGHKVMFCGNGGSAADAQHLAAEYVVRFRNERRALPAIALTVDTSILTACGNDYGFDRVFARQVEALGQAGDVLVLHSTSGESENLLLAAEEARRRGVVTVALLARGGGRLRHRVDLAVVVPTESTARAQEIHLAIGHLVCEHVDHVIGGQGA